MQHVHVILCLSCVTADVVYYLALSYRSILLVIRQNVGPSSAGHAACLIFCIDNTLYDLY